MILIQHAFAASQFYITTLSNEKIMDLRVTEAPAISRSDFGHWIAEPSAIRAIKEFADQNNHLFIEMVAK
jgi:hypothetical protein